MRITRRRVTAAVWGLVVCTLPGVMLAVDTPAPPCQYVDAHLTSDVEVTRLLTAGWAGDPTDGAERLYSPACR